MSVIPLYDGKSFRFLLFLVLVWRDALFRGSQELAKPVTDAR